MKEFSSVDLSIDWKTGMKYLIAVIESHAKKSYFKESDEQPVNSLVRYHLSRCAEVADIAVKMSKKDK